MFNERSILTNDEYFSLIGAKSLRFSSQIPALICQNTSLAAFVAARKYEQESLFRQ
jgi:hypothetical protein